MSTQTTTQLRSRSLPVRGGLVLVASVLVNVAIVALVGAVGVAPEFRALTIPPVAVLSALGAAGAAAVYALLRGRVTDPDRTFTRIAAGVLVLSFVPDLGLLVADPAATPLGVVVLMVMHAVVAGFAVWLLPTGGR